MRPEPMRFVSGSSSLVANISSDRRGEICVTVGRRARKYTYAETHYLTAANATSLAYALLAWAREGSGEMT